ncbi:hypothetical protein CEUSTIGMA_g3350.t1 [Chlamydomonas eustigma]|uniref:Uncharacterized protein n=1 Tax=Chlamydomonas eustigma TaxID=1157962 RepID=A0A250WYI5_9CHLO|nr:hypothetical protein CEUSTIGMA_g3350.t1 [Chlamydomonas eustigma]|eukprot:GAX75907.1 hypothetical protein CEUSTIGMA_g3350.t1 [Chlamydomonas eustigma]
MSPAKCYSKAGISSSAMFGAKSTRPKSAMVPRDYAVLFNKYYGPESVMDRIMKSQGKVAPPSPTSVIRPASALAADRSRALRSIPTQKGGHSEESEAKAMTESERIDKEIALRAARETHGKYLTPYLANKYGIEVEGYSGDQLFNPATQGLKMVPASGMPKDVALAAGDKRGAAKVMELAAQLEEAERQRLMRTITIKQRNSKAQAVRLVKPKSASSSFATTTREKAQKSSIRTGLSSAGKLGPGAYNSSRYHAYIRPNIATPGLGPKQGPEGQDRREDRDDDVYEHDCEGKRSGHDAKQLGTSSSGHSPSKGGATSHGQGAIRKLEPSGYFTTPQLGGKAMAIFKDAHRVHERRPASAGSSSFLVRSRMAIDHSSTASHLALKYFHEGYDSGVRKSPKLITKFHLQVHRPPLGTADTPPALGPGTYLNSDYMPDSLTGHHVTAGHGQHQRHTLDFSRQAARPGSAPTSRLLGTEPVGAAEAAAIIRSMYGHKGADLDPSSVYVGVHALMEGNSHDSRPRAKSAGLGRRPQSAAAALQLVRQQRARSAVWGTTGAIQEGDEEGVDGEVSALLGQMKRHEGIQPLGYQEMEKFSSAGLARRIPGGRISTATRETETKGMRAMSRDGIIPPASGPLRMGAGADVVYKPDDSVQAHRIRSPAWRLPTNRHEGSKSWIASAALAYT